MARRHEINKVVKILQGGESVLPGSLSRLIQRRKKGRNQFYWYLTWKEEGKSRAIYIPPQDVRYVRRGVENMEKVKVVISKIAIENLRKLKEGRGVRSKR